MSSRLSHQQATPVSAKIEAVVKQAGFDRFGIARLQTPISIGVYEQWLKERHHGDMNYLQRHLAPKRHPSLLMRRASTAIVMTVDYIPHPETIKETFPLSQATMIARYARGSDYHHFLGSRLKHVCAELKRQYPAEEFIYFTDSGPVLERELAVRAGLGWVGKNTCLIDRKRGSLFFICEIYTTLEIPVADLPIFDHCGTCRRCIDACPTGALGLSLSSTTSASLPDDKPLGAPRLMDANRCISYLTIEAKSVPVQELREQIGGWFFGCDICQTVCPWNIKLHGADQLSNEVSPSKRDRENLVADMRFILQSSHRELGRRFKGTALERAGAFGLKRNALIQIAHHKLTELTAEVNGFLTHTKLADLARWTLDRLSIQALK